jgi:hypothetical protein
MKNFLIAIISTTLFIQCTKENEIFNADTWHSTYETTINNRSTRLSPLVIDRAGNLTIAGQPVIYEYDVFTRSVIFSDVTINRERIHFAKLAFSLDGVTNTFDGEISTTHQGSTGKYEGRSSR